ncbi:MAG TPA: hypothetical protein VGI75_10555, partial [Pirellulales bacterium]
MTRSHTSRLARLLSAATLTALALGNVRHTGAQQVHADNPLNTGKSISPSQISRQDVGSLPINVLASPDGNYLITTDMGTQQALWSIRAADGKGVSHVDFLTRREGSRGSQKSTATKSDPAESDSVKMNTVKSEVAKSTDENKAESKSDTAKSTREPANGEAATETIASGSPRSNGLYYGLAFSSDNTLYAAQGGHDSIAVLSLSNSGELKLIDSIITKPKDFPAGIALDEHHHLYVANNASGAGNPLELSGSIAIYDTSAKTELGRYTFSASHGGTSNFPLVIAALRDGSKSFLASERDGCVYVLNTANASQPTLAATVATGAHPASVLLSKDQSRLFVANSLGDTISILDTVQNKVVDTIMLRPAMVRDIPGVTPLGMALAPDEKTLYVALADMNAVAMIDLTNNSVRGYLPTGWYPSTVAASSDGKRLFVANVKGRGALSQPRPKAEGHNSHDHLGTVSLIDVPDAA